jgi:hypothetical protein
VVDDDDGDVFPASTLPSSSGIFCVPDFSMGAFADSSVATCRSTSSEISDVSFTAALEKHSDGTSDSEDSTSCLTSNVDLLNGDGIVARILFFSDLTRACPSTKPLRFPVATFGIRDWTTCFVDISILEVPAGLTGEGVGVEAKDVDADDTGGVSDDVRANTHSTAATISSSFEPPRFIG